MFDPKEEERMMKRAFARYVIPTVIALVFEQIAPIVDSLCISHALGEEALSAISTVDPVYYFFNIIALLGGIGAGIGIAKASGSGDKEKAGRIFTKTLIGLILITVIVSILMLIFTEPLLKILSATKENHQYAKEYLTVLVSGMLFYVLNLSMTTILTNDNDPNLAMAGGIVAGTVNIIVDYVGIYIFRQGVWVTAFGTVFGMFVSCLVFLLHLRKKDRLCRFIRRKNVKNDISLKEIIMPGTPEGIQNILFTVRLLIINRLMNKYMGTSGLGNATVIENIELAGTILTAGISESVIPLFASYYGEENKFGLKMVRRSALILGQIAMLPFALLLLIRPEILLQVFSISDQLMTRTLPTSIRIIALAQPLIMFNFIFTGDLQSTGDENKASFSLILLTVTEIAFSILLSYPAPENGPWLATFIGNLCVFAYFVFYCKKFSGLRSGSPDNVCFIASGNSNRKELEGFFNAAKQFLSDDNGKTLWEGLFKPFLQAAGNKGNLPCSFLILEKKNKDHSVILRYESPESIIEDDTMIEVDAEDGEETGSVYNKCIRSEFNFSQRLLINFRSFS